MKISKATRGIIIAACLLAALICYGVGSIFGVGLFIAIGGILELAFWITLFTKSN